MEIIRQNSFEKEFRHLRKLYLGLVFFKNDLSAGLLLGATCKMGCYLEQLARWLLLRITYEFGYYLE